MKLSVVSLLSVAALATASHQGAKTMEYLMSLKSQSRERARAQGLLNINRYPDEGQKKCTGGKAGEYACENIDLLSFLSHQAMGSATREGNDLWGKLDILPKYRRANDAGWTSSEGREFGIVGQTDGAAFVEIVEDGSLVYVGRLGSQTESSTWRDIKVIGDHAYIGSEAPDHGLQVFDLNKVRPQSMGRGH